MTNDLAFSMRNRTKRKRESKIQEDGNKLVYQNREVTSGVGNKTSKARRIKIYASFPEARTARTSIS